MTVSGYRMINVAFIVALCLSTSLAYAQQFYGRVEHQGREQQFQQQSVRESQRYYVQRREEFSQQRQERMSVEERRQLRRDIKDAGREIYLPRP